MRSGGLALYSARAKRAALLRGKRSYAARAKKITPTELTRRNTAQSEQTERGFERGEETVELDTGEDDDSLAATNGGPSCGVLPRGLRRLETSTPKADAPSTHDTPAMIAPRTRALLSLVPAIGAGGSSSRCPDGASPCLPPAAAACTT